MNLEEFFSKQLDLYITTDETMRVCDFKTDTNTAFLLLQTIELIKISVNAKYPFCFQNPGITAAEKTELLADVKKLIDDLNPKANSDYEALLRDRLQIQVYAGKARRHTWFRPYYKLTYWWRGQNCYSLLAVLNGMYDAANTMPDKRAIYIAIKEAVIDR